MISRNCPRCGGEDKIPGALRGMVGGVSFLPKSTRFMTLETSTIPTVATMCSQCGLVEITGDVEKLSALVGSSLPDAEPAP